MNVPEWQLKGSNDGYSDGYFEVRALQVACLAAREFPERHEGLPEKDVKR
jgi:hypothetical protein